MNIGRKSVEKRSRGPSETPISVPLPVRAPSVPRLHGQNERGPGEYMARAGAIDLLVKLLGARTSGERAAAARALGTLSVNDDNEAAVPRAGAIHPLVKLLGASTSGVREDTGKAHRNISANDDNAVALARAGAIDPLVKLLGAGTSGERQAASRALGSLSLNPEAHTRVGVQEVA